MLRATSCVRPSITGHSVKSMRTSVMGKRVLLRRADLSEAELEKGVRPFIDANGDYQGELPEQPEHLTHWNANWSQGGPAYTYWTPKQALLAVAAFFGILFVVKLGFNLAQDPYPTVVPREINVSAEFGQPLPYNHYKKE